MFDSTPSNLPVEPGAKPAMPSVPPVGAPVAQTSMKGKKEPEDIFSGLDQGQSTGPSSAPPLMDEHPKRPFPIMAALIIVVAIMILAGGGYGVWMFFFTPKPTTPPVVETTPTVPAQSPIPAPPAAPTPTIETPPPAASETPVTTPPAGVNIPAPTPITPPTPEAPPAQAAVPGTDTDADGLTDVEERLYGTGPAVTDTDADGYTDGSEVRNLFSPLAKGAALSTEGYMQTVSWNGWSFLTFTSWSFVQNAENDQAASLATGTGTRFNFLVRPNSSRTPLAEWASANSEGARSFKTKGGFDALQTADGLTTYVAKDDTVLVVSYDLGGEASYEYRASYDMLLNSLGAAQ